MDQIVFAACLVLALAIAGAAFPQYRPFMNSHYMLTGRVPTTVAMLATATLAASLGFWRYVANVSPDYFWLPVPLVCVASVGFVVYGFRREPIPWLKRQRKKQRRKAH